MRAVLIGLLALWPALSFASLSADMVVVHKSRYSLSLMKDGKEVKSYWIALGPAPRGHKEKEGDQRTPEGRYLLDYKKTNTGYYKAIHISYPSLNDMAAAKAKGVEPGGMILIHGQRNSWGDPAVQRSNWTNGCIALLNKDMDEVYNAIEPGTPIVIYP
ncbi:L,D-transpeptidase catalytic domain [Aeromonas sp. RU39B]|jgi:murein L,D-transpeptidase YafK|uniref:L,D-transpeptidase family protein n=1 Tax=Aeromonas sp. RU39B TaxID=1907416 RepID=UPI000953EEE1|nr:L,D-transpeptidase family protein [Aeromonas sp. RU39B]SIR22700.1 L,D-transpeptidase catalytic domain [Aeromonas sp. RU39B]